MSSSLQPFLAKYIKFNYDVKGLYSHLILSINLGFMGILDSLYNKTVSLKFSIRKHNTTYLFLAYPINQSTVSLRYSGSLSSLTTCGPGGEVGGEGLAATDPVGGHGVNGRRAATGSKGR